MPNEKLRVKSINKQVCCCYKVGLQHFLELGMMMLLHEVISAHFNQQTLSCEDFIPRVIFLLQDFCTEILIETVQLIYYFSQNIFIFISMPQSPFFQAAKQLHLSHNCVFAKAFQILTSQYVIYLKEKNIVFRADNSNMEYVQPLKCVRRG